MGITISDSDLLVIKVEQGVPVDFPMTYSNFRLINPQTSFPELPDNSFLKDYNYSVFKYVEKPQPGLFENIVEGEFKWDDTRDAWTNTWITVPFTSEEMERARQQKIFFLKNQRDLLLRNSDFTQLPDVPITAEKREEWATYRQQLRDYMQLVTDPFNPPPFPQKPE